MMTESIKGFFFFCSLAISWKKAFFSASDGGFIDLRVVVMVEEAISFGALKSISLSCKYGILCLGFGISHLFSLEVQVVVLCTRTAVSTQ